LGERGWLRQVRQWFGHKAGQVEVSIGDDCAALNLNGIHGPLVVTTDSLIEGVHFRHEWIGARDLGARALAVNLSDLAAMGATPLAAFLALSVPPETPLRELKEFFQGFGAESRAFGCPLAGGDMTRAPQWTICVTVLGRPVVPGRLAFRSTARPGQLLYVTGWPGESGAGLAALVRGVSAPDLIRCHRRPLPRLGEAAVLTRLCPDLAMIDVSDGIWNDAGQLAEASAVRIELEDEALPASPEMERLARQLHNDPRDWALFGGEDYELLFATGASLEAVHSAFDRAHLATAVHCIGRVTAGKGLHLMNRDGREIRLADRTFRHF
jgi:thiamine-monophosphate kinase